MELAYQGLFIRLPFEGAVGVEAFEMNASFNDHVTLRLLLLVEEEKIEALIHGIGDGDDIEVYKAEADGLLYAGKITDAKMEQDRSLHLLQLEAASYTMEWGLAPVSQSFLNLDTTYSQVMDKVLKNQKDAELLDCATKGAVIPDFLLQYEESDWNFLVRLASHFHTFIVPDCRAAHGRAYFGIPDLGEEYVLSDEEFTEIKDMDQYYRLGREQKILPQETLKWKVTARQDFCLAQKVRFRGISAIVTRIQYQTVEGELVRTYELSRRKGVLCAPEKNPHIFGMSIPATVKERSGIDEGDIAKRLMDFGYHAPTLSFPVHGTLMVEPTESESKAELDRFVEVMECIWNEIKEVEEGKASKEDNVLKNAPHPEYEVTADEWKHAYPRTKAAFPLEWLHDSKFWINVARVDNAYGDRNLIPTLCACEI